MGPSPIKWFLIKIVPIFVIVLVAWQKYGLSHYYQSLVASVLNFFLPLFSPLIDGVMYDDNKFLLALIYQGKKGTVDFPARTTMLNFTMLLALYLASPIRPIVRTYFTFFLGSLAVMFVIHLFTLSAFFRMFIYDNPNLGTIQITRQTTFAEHYARFYELNGMYIFVLLLWGVYAAVYAASQRRLAAGETKSRSRAPTKAKQKAKGPAK